MFISSKELRFVKEQTHGAQVCQGCIMELRSAKKADDRQARQHDTSFTISNAASAPAAPWDARSHGSAAGLFLKYRNHLCW